MAKEYPDLPIKVPRFEESAGFYTTKQRSNIMSKIKGKNTKPEKIFRKALWKEGIRYRLNQKSLPGRPDISNKSLKFTIFIDGDFWHGYNWKEKRNSIKSNRKFWIPKIERNMQRDIQNNSKLLQMGFVVFRFWESEVLKQLPKCVKQVVGYVKLSQED